MCVVAPSGADDLLYGGLVHCSELMSSKSC
jgi:hypothetical protein